MSQSKNNQLQLWTEKEPPVKKLKLFNEKQLDNQQVNLNINDKAFLNNINKSDINLDNELDKNSIEKSKKINLNNGSTYLNNVNNGSTDLNNANNVLTNVNNGSTDLNNANNVLTNVNNVNNELTDLNDFINKSFINLENNQLPKENSINDKSTFNLDNNNNNLVSLNNKICKSNMNDVYETIFELNWTTKNKLVFNLGRYSQLLHTQSIDDKLRTELIKENNYLVCALMNLPIKSLNQNLETQNQDNKLSNVDNRTLDIKLSIRNTILNNLIKNHNSTIMYLNTCSKVTKKELIDENNSLITILTNLPSSKDIEDSQFDDFELFKQTELSSGKKFEYLNRIKEDLRKELKQEIVDTIQKSIRDCAEINLTFKFNIKELMATKEMISGDIFYLRNLPWCVQAQFKKDHSFNYLGLYLTCMHPSKEKWSINAKVRLILLNIAGFKEVEYTFFYGFIGVSCGLPKFITYQSLTNQAKGYVKDDSFYVACNVLAENLQIIS